MCDNVSPSKYLADEMDDDVEVARHIAMLAKVNQVDMNEATDGPLPTEEEIDEHALELAAARLSTNQAEPSADANLAAQMAECKELTRRLAECYAQDAERLKAQPMPLWAEGCRGLTMALFHPLSSRQLEELDFSGWENFPEHLLPKNLWDGLHHKIVNNNKWAYALAALLAYICAASGGEKIKLPSAAQLQTGMKWNAPPDSYYPHGALVGRAPAFMAQIPLLKHLATKCNPGKVGPATTKQGLQALVVSWKASLEEAKAEVSVETPPLSHNTLATTLTPLPTPRPATEGRHGAR